MAVVGRTRALALVASLLVSACGSTSSSAQSWRSPMPSCCVSHSVQSV